jgi:hypothetical protein
MSAAIEIVAAIANWPPDPRTSRKDVIAMLLIAGPSISMVVGSLASFNKDLLTYYMRRDVGSIIERCGHRQQRLDRQEWLLHWFPGKLLVTRHIPLPLFACGSAIRLWDINAPAAVVFTIVIVLGALVYALIGIAVVEVSPKSVSLRHLREKVWREILALALHSEPEFPRNHRFLNRSTRRHLRRQSPPRPFLQVQVQQREPWLTPTTLATLRKINAIDVRCVSWILWSITNPMALDLALRFASMVRWFEDGLAVNPPYHLIISILKACFDLTGKVYPELRDRAYLAAQAILWNHTCIRCKSMEVANMLPLPIIAYDPESLDPDPCLKNLLEICNVLGGPQTVALMYQIDPRFSPAHVQWTSNVLLRLSWAAREMIPIPGRYNQERGWTLPLNTALNRLLTSCIFFGWSVEEEALRIEDKS